MLVYQTLGSVRSSQITQTLQNALDQKLPGSGIEATCFKIKNTVAAGAKDSGISQFLQANNIIVGWRLSESRILQDLHAKRDTTLSAILSDLTPTQPSSTSQPSAAARSQLPQATVSTLIDLSVGMPAKMPVVLLASFYRGEQVKLKHLKEWMALDGPTVQSELLAQLDAIGVNLLDIEDVAQQLSNTIDAAGTPHELLMALDMKASQPEGGAKTEEAAAAAPASS